MKQYAPVEDRRDENGRFLPGSIPPGGKKPVVVGETREAILDALRNGETTERAAEIARISPASVYRAAHRDEELKDAIQQSILMRRTIDAEGLGQIRRRLMKAIKRFVTEDGDLAVKPSEIREIATALGILSDKEAMLAGISGSSVSKRVRIAWESPDGSRAAVEVD